MKKRVTIETIAKECGISKMAVSFALRGSKQVSVSLCEKVRRVADELGYVPSRAARSINGNILPRIGIVLPLPGSPGYARNLEAFDQVCRERGIETDIHFHYWHAESERQILQSLFDEGVTGLILHPSGRQTHQTLVRLQDAGLSVPFVTFGSLGVEQESILEKYLGNYAPETEYVSRICLKHVFDLGHRDIAFLFQGPILEYGSTPRQASSFLHTSRKFPGMRLELFYLDDSSSLIRQKILRGEPCSLDDHIATDDQLARYFLDHSFDATVAITFNDLSALSLLNECQRRHIRVPDALSILSLDGSTVCRMTSLSLAHTAVDMTCVANHVIDRLLNSNAAQKETYTYSLSMVEAETLSAPATKKTPRKTDIHTSHTDIHRTSSIQPKIRYENTL